MKKISYLLVIFLSINAFSQSNSTAYDSLPSPILSKKSELKITSLEEFYMRMKEMFELVDSLSERYKQGNDELRLEILKRCEFELFVDTKKELTIKKVQEIIFLLTIQEL